tara:strand:- start:511 stop:1377 length:867 start_codon:yes stop_codon:yes gene_type:complete
MEDWLETYFDYDLQLEDTLAVERTAKNGNPTKKQKTIGEFSRESNDLGSTNFYVDPDSYVDNEPEIDFEAETKEVENGDEAAEAWDVQAIPLCLMGTKERVDAITEQAVKQYKKKLKQLTSDCLKESSLSEIVREEVKKQRAIQRNPTAYPDGKYSAEDILHACRHHIRNVNGQLDTIYKNSKRSIALDKLHPLLLLLLEDLLFEDKPYTIIWRVNQFKAFTLRLKENKVANEREKKRFLDWKFQLERTGGKHRRSPSFKTTFPKMWTAELIQHVRSIRQIVMRMTGR